MTTTRAPLDLALRAQLRTRRLGRPHRHLASVGSTQTEAAAWAENGAATGAMVSADTQTAGRGRLGRGWADEPGRDLALSLVLRPALAPEKLGLVGLAAALGVAEALDARTPGVALKWPNDVLIGGKKAAGVLAETRWTACGGGHRPTVLLGIGVNVNRACFPDELTERATSLALQTGRDHDRAAVLADLLLALERVLSLDDRALVREAEARLSSLGREISVGFPGTNRPSVAGTVLGLDATGAMRLATSTGETRVLAGETTVLK